MIRCNAAKFMVTAALICSSAGAMAQDDGLNQNQLRAWIIAGNTAYQKQEYAKALQHYEKAYAMRQDPNLGYRIGQTYEKLGNYKKAQESFARYLKQRPNARYHARIEAKIKLLEEKQRKLQPFLTISTQPPGATIFINDVRQPKRTNATLPLGAGTYKVRVVLAKYKSVEEEVSLEPGQKLDRQYILESIAPKIVKEPKPKKVEPKVVKKKPKPAPDFKLKEEEEERPLTVVDIRPPLIWSTLGWISLIGGTGAGMFALLLWTSPFSTTEAATFSLVSLGLIGVGGYTLFVHDWSKHLESKSLQVGQGATEQRLPSAWGPGIRLTF